MTWLAPPGLILGPLRCQNGGICHSQRGAAPGGGPVEDLGDRILDPAAVSEEDLREIVATLVQGAKRGDMAALKLLLAYTIGRPTDAPNPDRVDLEGAELEEERRYTIL